MPDHKDGIPEIHQRKLSITVWTSILPMEHRKLEHWQRKTDVFT